MSIPFTWVYLIHDPFTDLYKIGKSDNPQARLKQLCNPTGYGTIPAAPTDYHLMEAWLCPEETEGRLHQTFAEVCVRGEWFDLVKYFDESINSPIEIEYRVGQYLENRERLLCPDTQRMDRDSQRIWSLQYDANHVPYLQQQLEHARLLGYIPPERLLYPKPAISPDGPMPEVVERFEEAYGASAVDLLQDVGELAF